MSNIGVLAEAWVTLKVDGASFDKELSAADKKLRARLQAWGDIAGSVRNVAAVAFGAGVLAINSFAKEAMEAEASIKRLDATLKGLGPTVGANKEQVQAWADELMRASDFDDEQIVDGFRKVASATGSAKEAMLAMEAATNLANISGVDLEQTSHALMMAYNGNTRGLKTLGIVLEDGVKGHEALVAVMKKVQGGNLNTADSTERAYRRMQVAWGNAKEALGTALLPVVQEVTRWLTIQVDKINDMSDAELRAWGETIKWGTALAGILVVGAQVTKWVIELRVALLALKIQQEAVNAQGLTMVNWLGKIPGLVAAALSAMALMKMQKMTDASLTGGEFQGGGNRIANSGYVATGLDAQGNPVYETPEQMAAQGKANWWELSVGGFWNYLNPWQLADSPGSNNGGPWQAREALKGVDAMREYSEDYIGRRKGGSRGAFLPPTAGEVEGEKVYPGYRTGSQGGDLRWQIGMAYHGN